ncbi:MAG: hypothetical protein JWO52_5299 [Gammaproteobacteria bacterium]|nr:hypothetical protein [Gammaproteobacteria bacterium]
MTLSLTEVGFIRLNDSADAFATQDGVVSVAHGFANPMAHEPRGLESHAESAVKGSRQL